MREGFTESVSYALAAAKGSDYQQQVGLRTQELFSALSYLNNPPRWNRRASETVRLDGEELFREVELTVKIPDDDFALGPIEIDPEDDFNFSLVALRPKK